MRLLIATFFVMALTATHAFAAYPDFGSIEYLMNHAGTGQYKVSLGTQVTTKKVQVMRAKYDFAKQGGAVGSITLVDSDGQAAQLPSKAIVKQVLIDVITAPTSGGAATLALTTGQGAGDLLGATAKASFTGLLAGVPVGSAASMIKLTATRTLSLAVATAALTAGKFDVFVEYYLSE